jgi:NAD(P)-dependent dehydrogenase (short-subunit alcohol dehydrogenase family)
MRLSDKADLVTGSSRGIGRAIALRFGEEGADVVINSDYDPVLDLNLKSLFSPPRRLSISCARRSGLAR